MGSFNSPFLVKLIISADFGVVFKMFVHIPAFLMFRNGMPTNEEQWTSWFQWMKSGNLEDQTIRNFYQAVVSMGNSVLC